MTVKTVRAESLPLSIQITAANAAGIQTLATAHRVGSLILVAYTDSVGVELHKDALVSYSRDLTGLAVKVCTVTGEHGPKMQTAKGHWYCKPCRCASYARSYSRKTGKATDGIAVTATQEKKAHSTARLERLLLIAPKSLTELRDNLLRSIAAADFYPTEDAKLARVVEVAALHGLSADEAVRIVAA